MGPTAGVHERPDQWGNLVTKRLFRPLVLWLLVVITWGVYRGLAATDDFIVVHLFRDAAGIAVVVLPLGWLLWLLADSFDIKPN